MTVTNKEMLEYIKTFDTQNEQIEEIKRKIATVRDCLVNGHKWNIRVPNVFSGECSNIEFHCSVCGAEKLMCWLHNKKHRQFVGLLKDAFNDIRYE